MKITQSRRYRRYIKLSLFFLEPPGLSQMSVQLSTSNKFHDEEDFVLGLEHVIHSH